MDKKMSAEVILAGIGQTAVGEHWNVSLRELGFRAIQAAIQDAGGLKPQALFVGNMLAPALSRQAHLGVLLADFAGLTGIEAVCVEAAGASGGAALRQGYLAVKSGLVDTALVVGVEKFTDSIGPEIEAALSTGADSDFEAVHGTTSTAQAALLARRYMHEHNLLPDCLAGFPLLAHANAAGNPNAMFRNAISLEAYREAEMVSEPVNLLDIAPNADGAAAVLLTRRERLLVGHQHPLVCIAASAQASDRFALHDRPDPLTFEAVRITIESALKQAGISRKQIDFMEYHDAYSIYAALSLESAGFAPRGKAWQMALDDRFSLGGRLPCATLGGLKARGNPGGASGVYQAVEAVLQLRSLAGENQVKDACFGLIQSLGGPASTVVTHIFSRTES